MRQSADKCVRVQKICQSANNVSEYKRRVHMWTVVSVSEHYTNGSNLKPESLSCHRNVTRLFSFSHRKCLIQSSHKSPNPDIEVTMTMYLVSGMGLRTGCVLLMKQSILSHPYHLSVIRKLCVLSLIFLQFVISFCFWIVSAQMST